LKTPVLLSLSFFLNTQASAEAMTFGQALEKLQTRSTDVQTQRHTLRQSEAVQLGSTANFLPSLSAEATDSQVNEPYFQQMQPAVIQSKINLFRSGADMASWKQGRANIKRQTEALSQAQLESEQANLILLVQYIQGQLARNVASSLYKMSQEYAEVELARYKRGLVPLQESQKAEVEKSNAAARMQDAEEAFETARAALEVELGGGTVETEWPWKKQLTVENVAKVLNRKLDLSLSPAYRASQYSIEAEEFGMRSKFRQFLPSLDLAVGYGYQNYRSWREPGWQTSLTLTVPLMDLHQHSEYRVQVEQQAIAQVGLEKVRRSLKADWEAVQAKFQRAVLSANEREISRQVAQSLYQDNQKRLRAGRTTFNDLMLDQNRLSDAETLAISGWADVHLLYGQLCHLRGQRVNPTSFGCI
jgi:outer membrane protein TolC